MRNKIAVLSFFVSENRCDPKGNLYINRSEKQATNISDFLSKHNVDVFIDINEKNMKPYFKEIKAKRLNIISASFEDMFSKNNLLEIPGIKKTNSVYKSVDYLDFILPPDEYVLFIVGIDFNGVFKETLKKLKSIGYKIFVLSDMAKLHTSETHETIKSLSIDFCSSNAAYTNVFGQKPKRRRTPNFKTKRQTGVRNGKN